MAEKAERLSPENQRLREAFATLLAQGNDQAVPLEAVMAAQGRSQWPQPAPPEGVTREPLFERKDTLITPLDIQRPEGYSIDNDVKAPTRILSGDDRFLRFPVQGEANRDNPAEAPFGGKGLVVGEYKPPEKKEKKKGKR
jgi:hypothetical protein